MWRKESVKLERESEIWFKSWTKVKFKLCIYHTSKQILFIFYNLLWFIPIYLYMEARVLGKGVW